MFLIVFFLKLNLPIHSKLFDEYANSKCSITFMKRKQFLFYTQTSKTHIKYKVSTLLTHMNYEDILHRP